MIIGNDMFSPITALLETHIATELSEHNTPLPWTVVQGWKKKYSGDHTFIVVVHHQQTDRILTFESNSAYKIDGVGFLNFGNLRDFPKGDAPTEWWKKSNAPIWADICKKYPYKKWLH